MIQRHDFPLMGILTCVMSQMFAQCNGCAQLPPGMIAFYEYVCNSKDFYFMLC